MIPLPWQSIIQSSLSTITPCTVRCWGWVTLSTDTGSPWARSTVSGHLNSSSQTVQLSQASPPPRPAAWCCLLEHILTLTPGTIDCWIFFCQGCNPDSSWYRVLGIAWTSLIGSESATERDTAADSARMMGFDWTFTTLWLGLKLAFSISTGLMYTF